MSITRCLAGLMLGCALVSLVGCNDDSPVTPSTGKANYIEWTDDRGARRCEVDCGVITELGTGECGVAGSDGSDGYMEIRVPEARTGRWELSEGASAILDFDTCEESRGGPEEPESSGWVEITEIHRMGSVVVSLEGRFEFTLAGLGSCGQWEQPRVCRAGSFSVAS